MGSCGVLWGLVSSCEFLWGLTVLTFRVLVRQPHQNPSEPIRPQSATSLLSLLFLLSLTRDNAINLLVIPRRGNREACKQEVSPMPRRGDLPLFMGDAEREGSVSARLPHKGRWPQNCMMRYPYQQGLRMQFFAMTVYKKLLAAKTARSRFLLRVE